MDIRVFQIDSEKDIDDVKFIGLQHLKSYQGTSEVNSEIYQCVYEGYVEAKNLEQVFFKLNHEHPDGYVGHSLSMSDIVEVINGGDVKPGFYFCDSIGFKEVDFEIKIQKEVKHKSKTKEMER